MDIRSTIRALGGSGEVARALGLPSASGAASVRGWVARDSIPPQWFIRLAMLAELKDASHITIEALLRHAEKRRAPRGGGIGTQQTAVAE